LVRAGDLADRTTFYRNDLAFAENPAVPKNPHGFLTAISTGVPLVTTIALGAQRQIATFFVSDGTVIIQPEPSRFFETPIAGPLPEQLNFIDTNPPIITITDASVTEGDRGIRTITFAIALSWASGLPVSVNYGTVDGTATAGEDYEAASGALVFAPG